VACSHSDKASTEPPSASKFSVKDSPGKTAPVPKIITLKTPVTAQMPPSTGSTSVFRVLTSQFVAAELAQPAGNNPQALRSTTGFNTATSLSLSASAPTAFTIANNSLPLVKDDKVSLNALSPQAVQPLNAVSQNLATTSTPLDATRTLSSTNANTTAIAQNTALANATAPTPNSPPSVANIPVIPSLTRNAPVLNATTASALAPVTAPSNNTLTTNATNFQATLPEATNFRATSFAATSEVAPVPLNNVQPLINAQPLSRIQPIVAAAPEPLVVASLPKVLPPSDFNIATANSLGSSTTSTSSGTSVSSNNTTASSGSSNTGSTNTSSGGTSTDSGFTPLKKDAPLPAPAPVPIPVPTTSSVKPSVGETTTTSTTSNKTNTSTDTSTGKTSSSTTNDTSTGTKSETSTAGGTTSNTGTTTGATNGGGTDASGTIPEGTALVKIAAATPTQASGVMAVDPILGNGDNEGGYIIETKVTGRVAAVLGPNGVPKNGASYNATARILDMNGQASSANLTGRTIRIFAHAFGSGICDDFVIDSGNVLNFSEIDEPDTQIGGLAYYLLPGTPPPLSQDHQCSMGDFTELKGEWLKFQEQPKSLIVFDSTIKSETSAASVLTTLTPKTAVDSPAENTLLTDPVKLDSKASPLLLNDTFQTFKRLP